MLESLSQAIKSAAFPVPSGLGVQEGGFVLLGSLFGIDPGTALALSLSSGARRGARRAGADGLAGDRGPARAGRKGVPPFP